MNLITALANRIERDLIELQIVLDRIESAWQHAERLNDDLYLDSVALNLHGFYSGLERIFERIAETVDGSIPTGENWHHLLLTQMNQEIPTIRPAVISQNTLQRLDEFRGFRHVVRNVYTFHFDEAKLERLVMGAGETFTQVKAEILAFADFLDLQE